MTLPEVNQGQASQHTVPLGLTGNTPALQVHIGFTRDGKVIYSTVFLLVQADDLDEEPLDVAEKEKHDPSKTDQPGHYVSP